MAVICYVIPTWQRFCIYNVLEFSYTQAPKKMKSFIMSAYLLSVSELFCCLVNIFIQNDDGSSNYEQTIIFAGCML